MAQEKEVYKITLTDNETISQDLGLNIDKESSAQESKSSCEIIGIEELSFETVEIGELYYNKELMQKIEAVIFKKKIDTVFMHFKDDYNQDHVQAHVLCKTAARHCKNLLMYQSNGYQLSDPFYPCVFSDISDFALKKYEALKCYGDQHNRFGKLFEIAMERNKVWGYAHKVEYAEAFVPIKIDV